MTVATFLKHRISSPIRHVMLDKISDDYNDKKVMLGSCCFNYFTLFTSVRCSHHCVCYLYKRIKFSFNYLKFEVIDLHALEIIVIYHLNLASSRVNSFGL